jgi:hypothetical protein
MKRANRDLSASGNRPFPLNERTFPEFSIVFRFGQLPSQIE